MTIQQILAQNNIPEQQCNMFAAYYKLLVEWNEKINLTAITGEEDVAYKHFIDCISIFKSGVIADGAKIIDVGTGAGFPGLPMKIYNNSLEVTLVDSLNKRLNFLTEVTDTLGLHNVRCVHGRAEDLGHNKLYREQFDICASRAVANLATLCELCLPFVKVGGYLAALKGPKADEEIAQAQKALKLLGGKVEKVINYSIADTDYDHNIVLIKKISAISAKYPRKAPKPSKEPLV
ncbi:MAG: 16S rRNA (guanine(527)-N(7))-methyltransferase RsmG [Clostridia bacterium]|nr:16S rRNA (guanine(527)-N(7))-methyltransferase RsmG [Clostridia bacterium]